MKIMGKMGKWKRKSKRESQKVEKRITEFERRRRRRRM